MFLNKYKDIFYEDNNNSFNNQLQKLNKIGKNTGSSKKDFFSQNENNFLKKKNFGKKLHYSNNYDYKNSYGKNHFNNQKENKRFSKKMEHKFSDTNNIFTNRNSILPNINYQKKNENSFKKKSFYKKNILTKKIDNIFGKKSNLNFKIKRTSKFIYQKSNIFENGIIENLSKNNYGKNKIKDTLDILNQKNNTILKEKKFYEKRNFILEKNLENVDIVNSLNSKKIKEKKRFIFDKKEKNKFIGVKTSLFLPSERKMKKKIREDFPLNLIYGKISFFRTHINDYDKEIKIKKISKSILNPKKFEKFQKKNFSDEKIIYKFENCIKKRLKARLDKGRKERLKIQKDYLMNDVSMALWAKARSLHELGQVEAAKKTYAQCIYMSCGRAWDPKGWFWSPAQDCANQVKLLLD